MLIEGRQFDLTDGIPLQTVTVSPLRETMNQSVENCPQDHNDYWVLPIFGFFIISGIFGNILVCLAISTNR